MAPGSQDLSSGVTVLQNSCFYWAGNWIWNGSSRPLNGTHSLVTPRSLKSLDDIMVLCRPSVTSGDVGAVVLKSDGSLYQMEASTILLI